MSIKLGLPMPEYLGIDALSGGVAHRIITQSPLHALNSKTFPRAASTPSNIGEICHRLLLERHEDNIVLAEFDDWRKKEAQELRKAAYAEGKIPILKHEMAPIRLMVQRAEMFIEQSELAGVFDNGHPEVVVEWDEDGVACKARPDWLSDDFHVSLKTTNAIGGANPSYWSRYQLSPQGYDFSLMFYRRGLLANNIDVQHRFLVIEQQKPHGCSVITLAPNKEAIADADVQRAIDIWRECERTKVYPGYSPETYWAEALPYELAQAEERELEYLAKGVAA